MKDRRDFPGDSDNGWHDDDGFSDMNPDEFSGPLGEPSTWWIKQLNPPIWPSSSSIHTMRAGTTGSLTPRRPKPTQGSTPKAGAPSSRPIERPEAPTPETFNRVDGFTPSPNESHPLFSQRYGADQMGGRRPPENTPNRSAGESNARGATGEYLNSSLHQRRSEDERLTGRRWPSNGLTFPGDPHEAGYFDSLAIALGEVSPRILARESALRYVRSSRIRSEDPLAPSDVHAIVYYGLGFTLRPLNCDGLPHVLGVYHRAAHEIYLDWKLFRDAPKGSAVLDPSAWRRAVDVSQLVRFLLAWCAAIHLTDNYDAPLVLGFAPTPTTMLGAAPYNQQQGSVALGGDTFNRYRKATEAVSTVLAPAERLWQQINALRLPLHIGERDWRTRLRAEFGAAPSWRQSQTPFGPNTQSGPDPVDQLIAVLAERNNCPGALIEAQLDGENFRLDWTSWSLQLMREIPALQQRYVTSARMFNQAGAQGNWNTVQGGVGAMNTPSVQAQLSL